MSHLFWQGARTGQSCFIDSLDFMDLDLIEIGDNVAVGEGATIVAHIFEEKSLKFNKVCSPQCFACHPMLPMTSCRSLSSSSQNLWKGIKFLNLPIYGYYVNICKSKSSFMPHFSGWVLRMQVIIKSGTVIEPFEVVTSSAKTNAASPTPEPKKDRKQLASLELTGHAYTSLQVKHPPTPHCNLCWQQC